MITTSATTRTAGRRTGVHAASRRTGDIRRGALIVATAATGIAGVLNGAAAAAHVGAGDVVVRFLGLTSVAQCAGAVALVSCAVGAGHRLTALLAAAGAVATTALICLYVVVHGTDLLSGVLEQPGLHAHGAAGPGHPVEVGGAVSLSSPARTPSEPMDALGTATVGVELLALAGFVAVLPPAGRRIAGNGLLVLAGGAWALWLTGLLD